MIERFYLGTHMPNWLGTLGVPLFVSHRRLARCNPKVLPVACAPWALDSGGFTELSMYGAWRTSPAEYIDAARRYRDEVGRLDWAAPQDWMCEPFMVEKTGMSVARHQGLTVDNFMHLKDAAPDVPFVPVVQGWQLDDYLRCVEQYAAAGVDLAMQPIVGVGSVCRRQSTDEIEHIFQELRLLGIRCHGFGVKMLGLARYSRHIVSADSMAWSYNARRNPPLPECQGRHQHCTNCPKWALAWRERLLAVAR